MDAYLISINQKQFKSAISSLNKDYIFLDALRKSNPDIEEKKLNKLSFSQEFVVKELRFDQDFQKTNNKWLQSRTPEFAFISIPATSPNNFLTEGYEQLKQILVRESACSVVSNQKNNFQPAIPDLYGTLNFLKIEFIKDSIYKSHIDLNNLGFGIMEESFGKEIFTSDDILSAHPEANKETMAVLTQHYLATMPQKHSNSITETFTRLATIAFTPQEKCHINFVTRLFMDIQRSEIDKLTTKINIQKLPELEGTPRQILYATSSHKKYLQLWFK